MSTLGSLSREFGTRNGGEREGHLVGIEPLLGGALALLLLGFADRDQGHAQPVLVKGFVKTRDLEIGSKQNLVDISLVPGGVLQRRFAATARGRAP